MPKQGFTVSEETRQKMREAASLRQSNLIRFGLVSEAEFTRATGAGLKWCTDCKAFLDPGMFTKGQKRCRTCSHRRWESYRDRYRDQLNAKRVEYHHSHPEQSAATNRRSKLKEYGVTPEWYDQQLASQDGKCAICRSEVPGGQGRFHIDHDHACHSEPRTACDHCRRGLLCSSCNIHIARLESDPGWFHRAMDYLKSHGSI